MKQRTRKAQSQYNKMYIGIDNGVSGSIGYVSANGAGQEPTPTFSQQNYTKAKGNITRIDHQELQHILRTLTSGMTQVFVAIERPMVNPTRFKASLSALRALETTQVILEVLELPYQFIDSKEWQKVMLPKGVKGSTELKKASLDMARRLFPHVIYKKDGDGILMAEWARREGL